MHSPISFTCDDVLLYVEDSRELTAGYGFVELSCGPGEHAEPETVSRSVVLGQGSIVVVLTEPRRSGPGRDHLPAHGDGLARIGLGCAGVRAAHARAVAHGARIIEPPHLEGTVWVAVLGGVADVLHTLVEQPPTAPTILPRLLLPGLGWVAREPVDRPPRLRDIDHVAICVRHGELAGVAAHYERAWGFESHHHRLPHHHLHYCAAPWDASAHEGRDRWAARGTRP